MMNNSGFLHVLTECHMNEELYETSSVLFLYIIVTSKIWKISHGYLYKSIKNTAYCSNVL